MQNTTETPSQKYLETLKLYYEEEIEGEAYFEGIADSLSDPDQKAKMMKLAAVEDYAAKAVFPLIEKYSITPRTREDLRASGFQQARGASSDWADLIAEMQKTFPGYVDDFLGLEALAPAEDLPLLKILTAHEVAAIDFLNAEAKAVANSDACMDHYLKTGTA